MSRIKIKNFGPLAISTNGNDGWLEIKKVTVFVGNQGSGKSTIAKLISTCVWIEKVLTRGDFKEKEFTASKFRNKYCGYHRVSSYFKKDRTEIYYEGDSYNFTYTKEGEFNIEKNTNALKSYSLPQIMYVPAERNFISIVNNPSLIKELPYSLLTFLSEYDKAKSIIKGNFDLPINSASLEYNKTNDTVSVKGGDYKVKLQEASSGFQSIVPLYLVSDFLSKSVRNQAVQSHKMSTDEAKRFEEEVSRIWSDEHFTDEQRRIALSALSSKFNKSAFINIVEEPEQNLFPKSQSLLLQSLLRFNNSLPANKLIITTHSPYLINDLTVAIKAGLLQTEKEINDETKERIDAVYPLSSSLVPNDVAVYEHNEPEACFSLLGNYKGIPSDENFLNVQLEDSNSRFADLLEIEQTL
ncbi:AAA family ATPase [Prevotella falsenii]|uniref:AAA family ATPase n=1 Tax=Prevotella falsenii TaxID=515414 RepID=UPI000469A8A8|nr:AAA family ATPase [Prevotella falsenii]